MRLNGQNELAAGSDDYPDDFEDGLFDEAAKEILQAGGYTPEMLSKGACSNLVRETFRVLGGGVVKGLGKEPDPEMASALRENAFVFSGFKIHNELGEVTNAFKYMPELTDDKGNIRPFHEISKEVDRILADHKIRGINARYNQAYLRAEYNQAVQSAQMAAKYHDALSRKDYINLQYRTANDERVRTEHQKLHGVTLPVDDPFWDKYTPPLGWNCRCTIAEVLKDDYPVSDSTRATSTAERITAKPKDKIFRFNPAKEKRVFPRQHPYLPKGCGDCKYKKLIFDSEKAICKACRKVDSASARWSRETVREHYNNILKGKVKWEINNGPVKDVSVSKSNISVLVGKAHKYQFAKNMAIYYLEKLLKNTKKVVYIGSSDDIKGNSAKGHTAETIWHYYKMKFLHGYSYISIKEYKGECIVHHIQDDEHFDESKIKYKVPYSLKASKPTSCVQNLTLQIYE